MIQPDHGTGLLSVDVLDLVRQDDLRSTLFDGELTVHVAGMVTQCLLLVRKGLRGRPVVVVRELPGNPGVSIVLAFEDLLQHVQQTWLSGDERPVLWLEHWPEAALASLLLHPKPLLATHHRVQRKGGWARLPLPVERLPALLST